MSIELPNFTCLIVGEPRTGKTSVLRKLSSKITNELYSLLKNHHPVLFSTNLGQITFDVRDTNDQEYHGSLRDSFFSNADCAIILFDVTTALTYENVHFWFRKVRTVAGNVPMVLCGNKIDYGTRRVLADQVENDWGHRMKYFEISVRNEESLCAPFLYLAQQLMTKLKVEVEITEINRIVSETNVDIDALHKWVDECQVL